MRQKILIVEDEFIVANDLQIMLVKAGYEVCGIAASLNEAKVFVDEQKPTLVLLDIFLQDDSMGTDLADYLAEKDIAFIYISASTNQDILEIAKATQPYGFLVKPFRKNDLLLMMDIAKEKHAHKIQLDQQKDIMLKNQLELITYSSLGHHEKWGRIPPIFQILIPFDFMRIAILRRKGENNDNLNIVRAGFDEYQLLQSKELAVYLGLTGREASRLNITDVLDFKPQLFNGDDYLQLVANEPVEKMLQGRFRLESKLYFPMELTNGDSAALSFYSRRNESYKQGQLDFFFKATDTLVMLLDSLKYENSSPHSEPSPKNRTLVGVNVHQASSLAGFHGIIGNSTALMDVLDKVSLVAPAQSTVLILGESGTGKERIAHCIHELSPRNSGPFITVNCAALPKELIESELFGHEKGAFTGALEKRIGKFELADKGTIFLDEVGELPLDAQVKLLRVLQEKEIERVGGSRSVKVNVRVITATNRQLEKEVAEGRFRLDLYYRLNVFPIDLPPLRERKSDIPILAEYFLEKFCREMSRPRTALSSSVLKQLEAHIWPGNIRELENLLERTLLLTRGNLIEHIGLPVVVQELPAPDKPDFGMKTLEEMEAAHIMDILLKCKGKIGGAGGAAEILGVPPSTLNSKIKKLGIKRESYFNK